MIRFKGGVLSFASEPLVPSDRAAVACNDCDRTSWDMMDTVIMTASGTADPGLRNADYGGDGRNAN